MSKEVRQFLEEHGSISFKELVGVLNCDESNLRRQIKDFSKYDKWKLNVEYCMVPYEYKMSQGKRIVETEEILIQPSPALRLIDWLNANKDRRGILEEMYLSQVEDALGYMLSRQYQVTTGNVGIGNNFYYIDGYDEEQRIAYEVDESHHILKHVSEKDKERQKYLEEYLGCTFVRIKAY